MRIAIVGSRTFDNYDQFKRVLEVVLTKLDVTEHGKPVLVSGGARGVDSMAELFCEENSLTCEVIKPDWGKYGKSAGFLRNTDIVKDVDLVIAFWDGESRGTLDSITKATKLGKPVHIIGVPTGSSYE